MPLPPRLKFLAVLAALLTTIVGCTRKIGDGCTTGTDCSQTGGRTCDTTMPGGYCTIANCEPDSCPDEAACIGFFSAPSTASLSEEIDCSRLFDSREQRTFCMRKCSSQSDCRGDYVCANLNESGNPWGAERLDNSSSDGRVCILPYTAIAANQADAALSGLGTISTRADYCAKVMVPFSDEGGYYAVGGASSVISSAAGSAGTAGAWGAAGTAGSPSDLGQAGSAGRDGSISGGGTSGAGNGSP